MEKITKEDLSQALVMSPSNVFTKGEDGSWQTDDDIRIVGKINQHTRKIYRKFKSTTSYGKTEKDRKPLGLDDDGNPKYRTVVVPVGDVKDLSVKTQNAASAMFAKRPGSCYLDGKDKKVKNEELLVVAKKGTALYDKLAASSSNAAPLEPKSNSKSKATVK